MWQKLEQIYKFMHLDGLFPEDRIYCDVIW